jgi:hypothetical protein
MLQYQNLSFVKHPLRKPEELHNMNFVPQLVLYTHNYETDSSRVSRTSRVLGVSNTSLRVSCKICLETQNIQVFPVSQKSVISVTLDKKI